ncbi:MAG TPA: hypothetical protein VHO47_01360 [Candidatus Babeliales bacterium]|nr:hypothetical protein [Candidatus Babeliales bacterium]
MVKHKKHIAIASIAIVAALILLVLISSLTTWYQTKAATDIVIVNHISQLSAIFTKINDDAGIMDFDHQKNYIDFLNVKSFSGSEVGSMNLAYPDKWQGPYLKENPTVQEQNYQVVRTKKGFFIVPGNGVKLSNGKVIGKDIVLDENADIPAMMADEKMLNFKGKALAAPVSMSKVAKKVLFQEWNSDALDVG